MVQLVSGLAPFFPELCSLGCPPVGEQLVDIAEAPDVTDLGHERGRGGRTHSRKQTLYSRRWIPLRKRAKIRPVSFHALRHTAATLALEDGQPPHVVAAMLGHASVATTLRLYAHVTHASTEALVDAIDARLGCR